MTALLEASDVVRHYPAGKHPRPGAVVQAVDGVSLTVDAGETLGVVGESGSGKSTLGRCLLRLEPLTSGRLVFAGRDITVLAERELRPMRREMQMVFQDPFSSLNPTRRIESILGTVLRLHNYGDRKAVANRVLELLALVHLPASYAGRLPHELSGGQRQRVAIARAIALTPRLVVCDEPVSALDVSVQAQILNLLEDIQDSTGVAYVLVAHDLGVVRQVADRVAVMYLGKIVEEASREDLYVHPRHPYTEALLSAVPIPDPEVADRRQRIRLSGEIPSPIDPPTGCRFRTRCPYADAICAAEEPVLRTDGLSETQRFACHHPRPPDPALEVALSGAQRAR